MSNLFGGSRKRKRSRKNSRLESSLFKKYGLVPPKKSCGVPYESSKYNKKSKKLMICAGNGRYVSHKNIHKILLSDLKRTIKEDTKYMKKSKIYDNDQLKKWSKWANTNASKYVKKYGGKSKGGTKWQHGSNAGEIVRIMIEDWDSKFM